MYLTDTRNQHMVQVLSLDDLFNPFSATVVGRYHYGEEAQDPEKFNKTELCFLSGEALPRCWTDAEYRKD